jgi:enediyne biosynthesis protein E2
MWNAGELVEPELRGFAYEGAAMAAVVRDAMTGYRTRRTEELLTGPARPHLFLSYIGIGFAMARLPRALWRTAFPGLDGLPHHPTMSWLAVDGYAFDLAYFRTRHFVYRMERPRPYPWLGRADYFPRVVDQGIRRALWFVHGADVHEVARTAARFDAHRRADLWSGVGLAAAVAGGAPEEDLYVLRRIAGEPPLPRPTRCGAPPSAFRAGAGMERVRRNGEVAPCRPTADAEDIPTRMPHLSTGEQSGREMASLATAGAHPERC